MQRSEAFEKFTGALHALFPQGELKAMFRIMEAELGKDAYSEKRLEDIIHRLKLHTPLQYILETTLFYGLPIRVNKNVLIPRPETEELVDLLIKENNNGKEMTVLDIGTGSGCIPLAIKKHLPRTTVFGCDVSKAALEVAQQNAVINQLKVEFFKCDILNITPEQSRKYDIIVSNPPYITESEKAAMAKNVTEHEPHLALFVSNNDPLQFYKAIAKFCESSLNPGGQIYLEVNAQYAQEVAQLFNTNGKFKATVIKDMSGKERFVTAKSLDI